MPAIPWLDINKLDFPSIECASEDPNGLLAVGGDLSTARILRAYRQGIFPWYDESQPILWWSPQPRAVLYPEKIYINRSLRKALRHADFTVSFDSAFDKVLNGCAEINPKRPGTWITDDMRGAYLALHQLGWAHSVEVWRGSELIGGLYGIGIGQMFFGESMFSREPNASKFALIHLCGQLQEWGYPIIDCQVGNDYLQSMGAEEIDRSLFKQHLNEYTNRIGQAVGMWEMHWRYSSSGSVGQT
ncbi:Leucyl/phenylalanyl-tRNA--protein transferase [Zhongshania aliphaticivorans]|uniref:Leucyl/phenylalanyl-tRNA--protein transferase n=1 Tax=Zhongshania aliphaticivorans TaxID=1470434 RepID=A0A5S9NEM9_9GAMM|nr:leucyl/phenylalanyl-tRNA--protein transferase [Zhongshania aliphaticivorans]CAA0088796.1 Leucyl/phenylalanyl-tRNA--protein transferase [Zhongshania aliphaticivorans]CAA0095164.1 Leucyl/phenylalanyl-tRNA--protein transferase [Zhongshania aliphaticivorans]